MIVGPPRTAVPTQVAVLAMWRAGPGALMLLGRAPGPIPRTGSARLSNLAGALGVFRAEFWQCVTEPGYAFLAAVRLSDRDDPADDGELALRGSRSADVDFRLRLVPALPEAEFGRKVASAAGANVGCLARFMLDVMRPEDGSDMRRPNSVLLAFLNMAARLDGCVELMLNVPEKNVVLQGWGTRPPETVDVLLSGPGLPRFSACSGDFPRNDVSMPATGNILLLPPDAATALPHLEKLFLVAGDEVLCRTVVEQRVLDPQASLGQIRHLLPRLSCPAPMHATLRAILQPRYEGQDTLNNGPRPVRAALDFAVARPGIGSYISGWVFDPSGQIADVHLCVDGAAERLDTSWTRVPRHDVSIAFATDRSFPAATDHEHGFAVAAELAPPDDGSAYIRVVFADGEMSFLPVRPAGLHTSTSVRALLASVDLHKPSGLPILEGHIAPLLSRFQPEPTVPGRVVLQGPLDRTRAIVVPLRRAVLPRAFVSGLLADPASDDEQIVFVCGPEWDHAGQKALRDLVEFYELPASIVSMTETPRAPEAVVQAARLTDAELFLLASPTLVGATGWRETLYEAKRSDVACPTVLYEDHSIRFAGSSEIRFIDAPPYAVVRTPLAGLPASLAPSGDPVAAEVGTFACCLLRRSALEALEQSKRYRTDAGQEAAFFAALSRFGLRGAWVSAVQVSAPDDDAEPGGGPAKLIDGWLLRAQSEGTVRCAS